MAKKSIVITVALTLSSLLFLPILVLAQDRPFVLKGQCPVTKIVGEVQACLTCHAMAGTKFTLKDFPPDGHLQYPNTATRIENGIGFYLLELVNANDFEKSIEYFKTKGIKRVVIQLQSPGGSLMAAWKIVGLMQDAKAQGVILETRVYGMAASAGFIIFASGSKGYRLASPTSELMWHELYSFKFFDISSPSDKEDEARVLRHFQDNANNFISSISKLSKNKIDELVRKKEFWMTGTSALEYGIADKLIGDVK